MPDCSFETNEQLTQTFIEKLPFPDINHDNEIFYSKESAYQMISFQWVSLKGNSKKY